MLVAAPDQRGALEAASELQQMGPGAGPALVAAIKADTGCQVQWIASGVLRQLGLEAALVETTLVGMARGACRASSTADLNLQQDASFALVDRPRGISVLADLLRRGDPLARRRAAVALGDLMARLQPQHPRAIEPTPEILAATVAALRPLRDAAVSRAHEQIRCPAFEALDRARGLPHEAVRAHATSFLAGARAECGPPPATAPSGAVAGSVRGESWAESIARLDTQAPEDASRTSAALLAAPAADVVPLLQQRLTQTSSCRGLALAAGVLASRNAAEADVEAAFARVVAGQCDGRDDFALALAQTAANALLAAPDGVSRLAGHLTDRDVAVRRRAAAALATLFERLGMGDAARPISDPATLGAARAAIPALLTVATTERDQRARCQAVLALQRAQEAQDAAIRADAEAQTRGRTIRCLAPPNP